MIFIDQGGKIRDCRIFMGKNYKIAPDNFWILLSQRGREKAIPI